MVKYVLITIYAFCIIATVKDFIFGRQERICNKKLIITKGLMKFNSEIFIGGICTGQLIVGVMLTPTYFRGGNVTILPILYVLSMGIWGIGKLFKGMKKEIREDGISINKGFFAWSEIDRYEKSKIKIKKNIFNGPLKYISFLFYTNTGYIEKFVINITIKDTKKIESFFNKIEKIDSFLRRGDKYYYKF